MSYARTPCVSLTLQRSHYPLQDGTSLEFVVCLFVDAVDQIKSVHPPFVDVIYQGSHYPLQGAHPPEAVGTSLEFVVCLFVAAVDQIQSVHPPFGRCFYQGPTTLPQALIRPKPLALPGGTATGRTGYCNDGSR